MATPTREQLEAYIDHAETIEGNDVPYYSSDHAAEIRDLKNWCGEVLRDAWRSTKARDDLGRQITEGLFGGPKK